MLAMWACKKSNKRGINKLWKSIYSIAIFSCSVLKHEQIETEMEMPALSFQLTLVHFQYFNKYSVMLVKKRN